MSLSIFRLINFGRVYTASLHCAQQHVGILLQFVSCCLNKNKSNNNITCIYEWVWILRRRAVIAFISVVLKYSFVYLKRNTNMPARQQPTCRTNYQTDTLSAKWNNKTQRNREKRTRKRVHLRPLLTLYCMQREWWPDKQVFFLIPK